jgi:gliding motility-associated-like protein
VINSQATALDYASFYGGNQSRDHVDGGTSRFDRKGVIYQAICAGCGGFDDLPVTPGAYSITNNSSNCNNALIKLDFESPIVISSFVLADTSGVNLSVPVGCAPFIVTFKNTSINATQYIWKIDGVDVSTDVNLTHLFSNSGKYEITLVATSSAACNTSDTSSMTITILDDIEGELSDLNACKGSQITLGPNGFDDPYYTFSWTPSLGLDNPSGRRPKLTASADTTYQLVISIGSCADTLYQRINIEGSKSVLPTLNICAADTATIGPAGPPPGGASFNWTPAATLSAPNTYNPKAFPAASTTYTLLMTKTGQTCPDTITQRVDVGSGSRTGLPEAKVCLGDSIQLGPLQALPDVTSFTWIPATGIGNPAIQNPKAFAQISRDYLLVMEKPGCNDTLDQKLTVVGQALEAFPLRQACLGDSATIGFDAPLPGTGISYSWSPPNLFNNPQLHNPRILVSSDQQYEVVISWPLDGCSDTLTTGVKALLDPFDAGPDVTACTGTPAEIGIPDPSGQYTYSWAPAALAANPLSAATQVNIAEPTTFYLTRTPTGTTAGCKGIDSLFVGLAEQPIAGFGYEIIPACDDLGVQLRDSSQNAAQLNWLLGGGLSSNQQEPLIRLAYGDSLIVMQIAINGACRDSALVLEKLKNLLDYYKEQDVNVFSPNGDGINDCFSPALQPTQTGIDDTFVECSTLLIYNRWGDKIFDSEKDNLPACWDGRTKGGGDLPEGVYFYRYVFKDNARAGYVHLRRNND